MVSEFRQKAASQGAPPQKNVHSPGVSQPTPNTSLDGFTQIFTPNGIWIGSGVFAGRTVESSRQTDHATTVTVGRTFAFGARESRKNSCS